MAKHNDEDQFGLWPMTSSGTDLPVNAESGIAARSQASVCRSIITVGSSMQVLVVGAGVVGLACARALALRGHEVIVAEAANAIGTMTSSRNSEVIHAGLYYPTGTKRAVHCPRSRRMLYDYCASHGVPHKKCGKLVVATKESEIARLEAVHKQAVINGCEGVELIDQAHARKIEPDVFCLTTMRSPETGIID